MRRSVGFLVASAVIVAVAGCGRTTHRETTTTPAQQLTLVRVYFLHGDRVQPVARFVSASEPAWLGAWKNLAGGPTGETPLALSTALRVEGGWTLGVTSDNLLSLRTSVQLSREFLAQAVYTLTQFAPKRPAIVNGKRYTRADFEDHTPIILVESPLPDQTVTSPLHATGTANTFEATFQYDLVGPDGKLIKTHFVTATSGTGTRGTFDFSVPFTVSRDGLGKLVVYELSAADGSRIHEVGIPIRLASS